MKYEVTTKKPTECYFVPGKAKAYEKFVITMIKKRSAKSTKATHQFAATASLPDAIPT